MFEFRNVCLVVCRVVKTLLLLDADRASGEARAALFVGQDPFGLRDDAGLDAGDGTSDINWNRNSGDG
jgi:hypothetical protein